LANFENPTGPGQTIQFIEKEPTAPGATTLKTVNDGTTNEEVLAMLADRMKFLVAKLPSNEASQAITKIEEALALLELRTLNRKTTGVEGTNAQIPAK
jgi:hypothetical protein